MGADKQAPVLGNRRLDPETGTFDGEPYRVRKHKPKLKVTEVAKINLGGDRIKGKGMTTAGHRVKMTRRYDALALSKPERKVKKPSRSLAEQFAAVGMGPTEVRKRANIERD